MHPRSPHSDHNFDWRSWRRAVLIVAGLVALIGLFYAEENWRGKRAWENYQREMAARGKSFDWKAYIPPPVPDDQNIFKAPQIAAWFTRQSGAASSGSSLSMRMTIASLRQFVSERGCGIAATVTVACADAKIAPGSADLVLDYDDPVLSISDLAGSTNLYSPIPLIVLDDAPLPDAIKNLARASGLEYSFDTEADWAKSGQAGTVSVRWTNVSPQKALSALLKTYDLVMTSGSNASEVHIGSRNPAARVFASPAVRDKLNDLIRGALYPNGGAETHSSATQRLSAPLGFVFEPRNVNPVKPANIVVRAGTVPGLSEVEAFFSKIIVSNAANSRVQAEPVGSNSFRVFLNPPPSISATDYLAWSDQFEPDFDLVREALKRPYARMDGDYTRPSQMVIPNFVTLRVVAQTLTARIQSELLLGLPDGALRDLTLLHGLRRIMEGSPSRRPTTLVAGMIDVAIAGLYVSVVADGLHLRAWQEPQLAAIQSQLKEKDLMPIVVAAFETEQAAVCRTIEISSASEFRNQFAISSASTSAWDKLSDPFFLFVTFGPRGWLYLNMATIASLEQEALDPVDAQHHLLAPYKLDETSRHLLSRLDRTVSPSIFLAQRIVPNFTKAWQSLAWNQTMVNEAQVACALERYRLSQGQYPESLDTLTPQFMEMVPADIIGARPLKFRLKEDGSFLLYSVGWNETDDGGVIGKSNNGQSDRQKGDWVWPPQ